MMEKHFNQNQNECFYCLAMINHRKFNIDAQRWFIVTYEVLELSSLRVQHLPAVSGFLYLKVVDVQLLLYCTSSLLCIPICLCATLSMCDLNVREGLRDEDPFDPSNWKKQSSESYFNGKDQRSTVASCCEHEKVICDCEVGQCQKRLWWDK